MSRMIMKHQRHCLRSAVMMIGATVMFGCANFQPLPKDTIPAPVTLSSESTSGNLHLDADVPPKNGELKSGDYATFNIQNIKKAPLLQIGTKNEQAIGFHLPQEPVSLNADSLPLQHFINLALGDVLKLNYLVDSDLEKKKTTITLRVNKPVSAKRLLGLVEEALQVNGIALAQDGDLIKVIPAAKASNSAPMMMQESMKPLLRYGKVTEIIPVYYLGVNKASSLASNLFREGHGGSVLMQPHLSSLMVVAVPDDIEKFRVLLAQLDVPNKVSSYMTLISPRFLIASDLARQLQVALSAASIPVSINVGNNGVVLKALNNEQLIITSNTQAWLNYAQEWTKRLDIPPKTEAKHNGIYVYYMKNTKAKDTWSVVETIFGDKKSTNKNNGIAAQDILAAAQQQDNVDNRSSSQGILPGNTGTQRRNRATTQTMSVVNKDYKVVVDDDRNSLIFQGSYQDYQRLIDLLAYVDIRPRQVLIKATVAEVSLNDAYNLGLDLSSNGSSHITGNSNVIDGNSSSFATLTGVFGDFTAKFRALLSNGKAQVLSSPKILAVDGEPASISIGQQIQVITGTVSNSDSSSGNVTSTYQYITTGIQLDITPSINESGLVAMEISQQVSSADNPSSTSTAVNTRSLQTSLLADSGETVYMGGLIKTRNDKTENKVPLLGDIPVLGHLFQYTSNTQSSTELILLITPYVIKNQEEALMYTKEFSQITGWTMPSTFF